MQSLRRIRKLFFLTLLFVPMTVILHVTMLLGRQEIDYEQHVHIIHIKADDIEDKILAFNQRLLIETAQYGANTSAFCDNFVTWNIFRRRQPPKANVRLLLQDLVSPNVLGTPHWNALHKQMRTLPLPNVTDSVANPLTSTHPYTFYNPKQPINGVKRFVLSSLRERNSSTVTYTSYVPHYYDCHVSERLAKAGGFKNMSSNMSPSICNRHCSQSYDVLKTPIAIPDYALHVDFYRFNYLSTCFVRGTNSYKFTSHAADYALHNLITGDFLQSLDVITDGGLVTRFGNAVTYDNEILVPYQCHKRRNERIDSLDRYTLRFYGPHNVSCVPEVFLISERPEFNYFHFTIEQFTRLAGFVHFLQQRPQVAIHVEQNSTQIARKFLPLFGLTNPVVSGVIKANVIFMPQGGGLHNPMIASLQLASSLYHKYVIHNIVPTQQTALFDRYGKKPFIIFIKRKSRAIANYDEIIALCQQLATRIDHSVYVYDDTALPSLDDTMWLFYHARLIIGPHGAGMANMVFARPGAAVVEIHCNDRRYIRLAPRLMALKLGLRYHGSVSTQAPATSERCADEGVTADVQEIQELFLYFSKNNVLNSP